MLKKILLTNILVVLVGAVGGTWLTAYLAQTGDFSPLTFMTLVVGAIGLSAVANYLLLRRAFRPLTDLHALLQGVHAGVATRPRADSLNPNNIRAFTEGVELMLKKLDDNAVVIQEDQRQLQLMTARVINAQEAERKRIARELHDEASQSLTSIIIGIEAAMRAVPDGDERTLAELRRRLTLVKGLAGATLEELRKLALDLRPTMLDDLGLVPALRWVTRTAGERGGFAVHLDTAGLDVAGHSQEWLRLPSELETCLFRITQESLTNITRHAHALDVWVSIERMPAISPAPPPSAHGHGLKPEQYAAMMRAHDELFKTNTRGGQLHEVIRLTISDNGIGFDRAVARQAAYEGAHLGLFDIEERATLLGGHATITTAPGQGTRVQVMIPLPAAAPRTDSPVQPEPAQVAA